MLSVRLFLSALWKRWWALVGSAALTLIGFYALLTNRSNHWLVTATIVAGLLFFLVAAFGAWKEQYDLRIAAESKNQSSSRPLFVLQTVGTQPFNGNSDWRFLISNHGGRPARYLELSTMRSEIGTYEIIFDQVPVVPSAGTATVNYRVVDRRASDARNPHPTLRDFVLDNTGERGYSYFSFESILSYQDVDDSKANGGTFVIGFDVQNGRLWASPKAT